MQFLQSWWSFCRSRFCKGFVGYKADNLDRVSQSSQRFWLLDQRLFLLPTVNLQSAIAVLNQLGAWERGRKDSSYKKALIIQIGLLFILNWIDFRLFVIRLLPL